MSFSRAQQPELRASLAWAWAAHCRADGLAEAIGSQCLRKRCGQAGCDYCSWYEAVLEGATGQRSSTLCNAGRDYDFFMRDLEVIHGRSIRWQMKAFGGDANRILHGLREVSDEHGLDEDYLRGVARRMLKRDDLPELHTLSREVLIEILGEVKRFVRRRLKRGPEPERDDVPKASGFHRVRHGVVSPENCLF